MNATKYKSILFLAVLLLWFTPLIFTFAPTPFKLKPLGGTFTKISPLPKFTIDSWMAGKFQEESDNYVEDHIGFRSFFIKTRNQLDFYCFDKANAHNIIVGKDDYLFDRRYIASAIGADFQGTNKIRENVKKVKALQEKLKEKNIDLIIVIAPGKGFYYKEYIPEDYLAFKNSITNYEVYVQLMNEQKINLIDFNKYFLSQKEKSTYTIYPKTGIHWSTYAGILAGDSLIHYLEKIRQIDMPDLNYDKINVTNTSRNTDDDILRCMNLWVEIPNPPLAYMDLKFEKDSLKIKPSVLTIGDSFYYTIFTQEIPHHVYQSPEFWYYNKEVHMKDPWNFTPIDSNNIQQKIISQDAIVIIQTESNLNNFGFGFIEKALDALKK